MPNISLKPGEQLPDTAEQLYILMPDGTYALQLGSTPTLPVTMSESWRVSLLTDVTANDSDKSFPVPADTEYQIIWVYIEFTTDATVGDRQLEVQVQDTGPSLIGVLARAGDVQAASVTRKYLFAPGTSDLGTFRDTDFMTTPIPPTFLKAGDSIRIFDNAAIAALDDMTVRVQIASRSV